MHNRSHSKNLTFSEQWGEYFENPADYPIWNYLLQEHARRFDENYMDALFIELKNKFALLGVEVEAKYSGIKHDDNKKSEDEFVIPTRIPNSIEKIKSQAIIKSADLLHFQIKNFKVSQIKTLIEKEMVQYADSVVDELNEERAELVLGMLNHFRTQSKKELGIADINQYELFQQLIETLIAAYKKHKLNNEMEIFFDRNPCKIKVLDGIDSDNKKSHERYVCNFIFLMQQYFIKNLDKIKSSNMNFDVYRKQEEVLRFVKQVLHLLDQEVLLRECEQAIYFVMSDECDADYVKKAHTRVTSLPMIVPVQAIPTAATVISPQTNTHSSHLKTALYVACGVLIGISIIAAFVFAGGLPLLMGFLAIHLIHVAPLIVKLCLVVAGVVAGGGLGFGSKKIADVTETKEISEVMELEKLPVVYKVVDKKEGKKIKYNDQPSPSSKGVFAACSVTEPRLSKARIDDMTINSSSPHVHMS